MPKQEEFPPHLQPGLKQHMSVSWLLWWCRNQCKAVQPKYYPIASGSRGAEKSVATQER